MIDNSHLPACPVETTLLFLSDKWKVLIFRELLNGSKRNSELLHALSPISQKVLTHNLRDLEDKGMISRKVYPVVPPMVEYSLTELGKTMIPVINAMKRWGLAYKEKYEER